jgi:hypothetical protein
MTPKTPKQHFIIVKTKSSGCFISDNLEFYKYHQGSIARFLFDGKPPEKTQLNDWFKIADVPTKVELIRAPTQKILGYKLKLGYAPSERLLANVDSAFISENEEFGMFYERITEEIPQENELIEFDLHVIAEKDKWEPVRTDFKLKYGLIDRLTLHPVLLPERPCELSREESYKIIREYVKANINPKVAYVSSDYDFCFGVSKTIPLNESVPYQKDVSSYRARKPKYETAYQTGRKVLVYETAPKPYQSYPVCEPFWGENYEALKRNIDAFLKELIEKINEPLCDCPTCKGRGVIINKI